MLTPIYSSITAHTQPYKQVPCSVRALNESQLPLAHANVHSVGVDELSSAGAAASRALVISPSSANYEVMVGGAGRSVARCDTAITASGASLATVSSKVVTTSAGEAILHYRPNIIQIISSNSSSSSSNSTSSLTTQTTDPFDCKCGHN